MFYFSNQAGSLIAIAESVTDFVAPETAPGGLLQFGLIRLILLICWIYLCMHSVHRVEFGSLVAAR